MPKDRKVDVIPRTTGIGEMLRRRRNSVELGDPTGGSYGASPDRPGEKTIISPYLAITTDQEKKK